MRRQAFAHCEQFPTAASRRSLGRISVPVWPSALSGRLPIGALVSRYLTNKLIGRGPLNKRQVLRSPALITIRPRTGCHAVLAFLSKRYPPLEGRSPTRYSPVRHSTYGRSRFRVRLACVKHAASVDSEPGSNSRVKTCSRPTFRLRPTHPVFALRLRRDKQREAWTKSKLIKLQKPV